MTAVGPADIGKASGTFNMLRQLGGVFGVATSAAVFAAHGGYASAAAFTSGFGPAMGACAGLSLGLLDSAEHGLYQDLVNGTFGPAVRLEQERVSFACLDRALACDGITA